jgi:hypothetical protein
MIAVRGFFYEFHFERVVSRPGQPLETRVGLEIGPQITRESALSRVRSGGNVYTLLSEDAYRLALQVSPRRPEQDLPHDPRESSPTGRTDVYFRHYHPGGDHKNYGHIFFGQRGERHAGAH